MSITHSKDIESPELQATIVEPILKCCINKPSILELSWSVQTMLSLPCYIIKNYLFYLIDYEVISYNGQKRIFTITDRGYELLDMIEKETRQEKKDIKDISVVFEYE
jgi:predicted transcriptional regulator